MPLQLLFLDDAVRGICERRQVADLLLGSRAARCLRARISDIPAAERISEVVAGAPTILAREHIAFDLHPPHQLILEPAMRRTPTQKNGEIDWDAIDTFMVIRVG